MIDVAEMHPRGAMAKNKFEPLAKEIYTLKKQLNAVILAHNYQVPEIQDVADFTGDSLGLAQQAAKTDADVIVFCGVHFMAETAKILNPDKIVVLPDKDAGCSLEESCPAPCPREAAGDEPEFLDDCLHQLQRGGEGVVRRDLHERQRGTHRPRRAEGPGLLVRAGRESRPMGDGTDGPADDVVEGKLLRARRVPARAVLKLKAQFPDAKVVVHPESLREVRDLADAVCLDGEDDFVLQE